MLLLKKPKSWASARKVLGQNFIKQLQAFNVDSVFDSETTLTKVKAEIAGLNDIKQDKKYPAATNLLEWVTSVIQECEVVSMIYSKQAYVDTLQKKLDEDNKDLIHMRSELETLTEDIYILENENKVE